MNTITETSCTWAAPARSRSVPTLRQNVEGWLVDQGVSAELVDQWRLIVSELAANACQNSPRDAIVTIEACRQPGRIELRVRNPVDGPIGPIVPHDPGPLANRGRGLHIVEQLADGLDIDVQPRVVEIACWLGAPAD